MKKFVIFLLFVSLPKGFASSLCDSTDLHARFYSVYNIKLNQEKLRRFYNNFSDLNSIFFKELSDRFQRLGNSEIDFQEKFKLQLDSRRQLRNMAKNQKWPLLNSLEGPYDVVFKQNYTRDRILNSVFELRLLLADLPVQPEIVIWKYIYQPKYNPFLVSRIVIRSAPDMILVNYLPKEGSSQWYPLDQFLNVYVSEWCQ